MVTELQLQKFRIAKEKVRARRIKEGAKALKEKTKLEKAELTTSKFKATQREKEQKKKSKAFKKLEGFLSKKIKSKKILKPSQMTITIKKTEQEPYKPIYMKEFIENEKRSMFFD